MDAQEHLDAGGDTIMGVDEGVDAEDALLSLPETEAVQAWRQLPLEELLAEVEKYRGAIRNAASRLRTLGDTGLPPPSADHLLTFTRPDPGADASGGPASAADGAADAGDVEEADAAAEGGSGGGEAAAATDPELAHLGEEGTDYVLGSVDDLDPSEWQVPPHCVPIHANVTTFDWPCLYEHCQFDVIMMDPPWQLATANPTRGVALGYSQLSDDHISGLPVPQLQHAGGFLFVWVINAKYKWTLDLFDKWGYRLVDEVVWVKMTVNRRLAKSHGYYLQHAKEVCLVAKRGNPPALAGTDPGVSEGVGSDIIFSERRGQSQKPEEIYELVEQLVPNGRYLEIFARKNNLRNYWVSIGNEVTGTGLPEEDMKAMREINRIPGAVYGKNGGGGGGGGGAVAGGKRGPSPAPGGGARQTSGGSGRARTPTPPPPAVRPPPPTGTDAEALKPSTEADKEVEDSNLAAAGLGPGSKRRRSAAPELREAPGGGPLAAQQAVPQALEVGGAAGSAATAAAPAPIAPAAEVGLAAQPPAAAAGPVAAGPVAAGPVAAADGGRVAPGRVSLGVSGLSGLSGPLAGFDDPMDSASFGAGVGLGPGEEPGWA